MRHGNVLGSLFRIVAWSLTGLVVMILAVIGTLFVYYSNLPWAWLRTLLAVAFVGLIIGSFVFLKPRWKALVVFAGLFTTLTIWYSMIPASNDRNWQPEVAHVATADIDGDILTIHDMRDFRYSNVDEYTAKWETRTFDLSGLESLDFLFSYWGPQAIAHTMLSFGFSDGEYICVSVETRKEIGETYDPLRSFFKQFELIYIIADERDLIAVRTNYRHEDTYLFPFDYEVDEIRALLLDILDATNRLAHTPDHYRTIRDNCTTSLIWNAPDSDTVYVAVVPSAPVVGPVIVHNAGP